MLSRVADSLYWMSRYLERAEHTARLIDVDLQLGLDQSPLAGSERWRRLFEALQVPESLTGTLDSISVTHTLTLNRSNPSSIFCCVAAARDSLRHVREQCSSAMWENLNRLYLQTIDIPQTETSILQSGEFFRSVQEGGHLFQGITDSTMTHGEGWHYIQLGRFVERTETVAALVGTHFKRLSQPPDQSVDGAEYLEWVGLLKSCDAFEAYCKAYSAELRPQRVAEFLLLTLEFPHSLRFSAEMIHTALRLVGDLTKRDAELPVRLTGRLRATLSLTPIEEIMAEGVHGYLNDVRRQCGQVHAAVHQIYFDYPVESSFAA
jgi:uncharacterized alpha-E superfamily protein